MKAARIKAHTIPRTKSSTSATLFCLLPLSHGPASIMSRRDNHSLPNPHSHSPSRKKMLQGSHHLPLPGWLDQAAYSSIRSRPVVPPHAYSSYPNYDQSSQVAAAHDTTYAPTVNSNVLTSAAPHLSNQSPIASTWPIGFADTTSFGHSASPYLRHDNSGGASSSSATAAAAAPPHTSTSRAMSTSRASRVGPRKTLSDDDRRDICLYHRQHPGKKQTEIGGGSVRFQTNLTSDELTHPIYRSIWC